MNKKLVIIYILIIIVIACASFLGGILVGENINNDKNKISDTDIKNETTNDKTDLSSQKYNTETFYAKIENISEYNGITSIKVQGLDVNDINYRGEFDFSIKTETIITWRGENIDIFDLKVGSNISITYDGNILESYPAQITNVKKIQLLDDKDTETSNNTKTGKFIKTYYVYNVAESMVEEYLYLTIRQFQFEEVETVKVERSLANTVKANGSYEFEFEYTNNKIEHNIKSIFENATLISIKKTDKQGLDQIQDI